MVASGSVPISREETWHAVASLLVRRPRRLVLLARNGSGGWGTAGGHVEADDPSIRSAVVREAQEELGLVLDPAALSPLLFLPDTMAFRPGHAHWDFCYLHVADEQVAVVVGGRRDGSAVVLPRRPARHERAHAPPVALRQRGRRSRLTLTTA